MSLPKARGHRTTELSGMLLPFTIALRANAEDGEGISRFWDSM